MPDMDATVTTRYEVGGHMRGKDGYEVTFMADDSFKSWFCVVRWNLHYRHWSALRMNARSLFTNVLRRKLWRQ